MDKPQLLSIDAVKDYQVCSLYYNYKHLDKLMEPLSSKDIFLKRYTLKIKSIIAFMFYKMQAGAVPSYSAVLNRWEKLWFPSSTDSYDIAVRQQDIASKNLTSYSTDAARILLDLYKTYVESNYMPMMINEEFFVPRKTYSIHGSFDLVIRDVKTKEINVIKWVSSLGRINTDNYAMDLALLKDGFDTRNIGRDVKVTYGLYDILGKKKFIAVTPTDHDVDTMLYWADQITDNPTYVPRRGLTKYCAGCPFDKPCSKFNLKTMGYVK